jgi:DNA polymerase III delta prime subunit
MNNSGVIELNASEVTGVEAIKEIAAGSLYGPVPPAKRRVYILDEAQRLSRNAQDCLLKYFEDAPKTTAWIICTTEPEAISRTLRRRCMRYNMLQLRGKAVDKFVKFCATAVKCTREVGQFIDLVHMRGVTSPGIIQNAFELFNSGIDPDKALHAIDSEVDTLRICQALLRGEWGQIRSELEKATAADSRAIRSSVLGYLRGVLLSKNPTVDAKLLVAAIQDISQIGYVDEASLPAVIAASLWRAARRF